MESDLSAWAPDLELSPTEGEAAITIQETKERNRILLKLFLKGSFSEVNDDEVPSFRRHPDEIDEVTASVNVQKSLLWAGTLLGTVCVAASKVLDDDEVLNASCAPGGYIYVFTGLMRYLDHEDPLVGVLGRLVTSSARDRTPSL